MLIFQGLGLLFVFFFFFFFPLLKRGDLFPKLRGLPKMFLTLKTVVSSGVAVGGGGVNLREVGCLSSAFFYSAPSSTPPSLPAAFLCEVFCLSFVFHQSSALPFLRFLPSAADGSKWVSPLSRASGHAGRPCRLAGRAAQGLDAPSAGTSAGLPVLVLFI